MRTLLQSARGSMLDLATGLMVGAAASALTLQLLHPLQNRALTIAILFAVAEVVALLLGAWSGVAALAVSALCLTVFVFEPVGSLHIASLSERHILAKMLMAGIPVCLALSWCSVVSLRNRSFGRPIR
jgi:K+-sensing histidine kinase KdpD